MQTCRKINFFCTDHALPRSHGKIILGVKAVVLSVAMSFGLSGCMNQNLAAPIDTIHNFGDPTQSNLADPQVSVPAEGNSDEQWVKSASAQTENADADTHPSQLIVQRRWNYDQPSNQASNQASNQSDALSRQGSGAVAGSKSGDKATVVTKTPVRGIVNGDLISDDAGVLKIQADRGEKVRSVVPGSVIYIGPSVQGVGKMVIVKSSEGMLFAYSHLQSTAVSEGAHVAKSDVLGAASDEPLVFQVRQSGGVLDGKKYIN
jgi:murein DD-endopeptidase MepM/ murein hydrolase activator NlpD